LSGLDIEFRKVMDRYYMENPPLDGRIASHYLLLSRCDRLDEFSMDFIARKVFDIEQKLEQAEARVAELETDSENLISIGNAMYNVIEVLDEGGNWPESKIGKAWVDEVMSNNKEQES